MNGTRQTKRILIILGVVMAIIVIAGVLGKNYLLPWQKPLYDTRQALVKYMKKTHPKYHIVKQEVRKSYTTGGGFFPLPETVKPIARFVCDEEGFQYTVFASDGKVTSDTYARGKLGYEIEEFARKGFLEPRGIENVDFYFEFDVDDDKLPSEWSAYSDRFWVNINVRGQGTTPQSVGWLWDFCEFWRENQRFGANWSLRFDIYYDTNKNAGWDSSISIDHTEDFGSAESWYSEKTNIPNPKPIH